MIMDMLRNIQPMDYVKAAFKANGYDNFNIINQTSLSRFHSPTKEMIYEYKTEIVTAVRSNDVEMARRLYKEGKFKCNACNRFGESILHIACRRGHYGMVQFLIEDVGLRVKNSRRLSPYAVAWCLLERDGCVRCSRLSIEATGRRWVTFVERCTWIHPSRIRPLRTSWEMVSILMGAEVDVPNNNNNHDGVTKWW